MPRHALGGALIGISVLAAQVAAGKMEQQTPCWTTVVVI